VVVGDEGEHRGLTQPLKRARGNAGENAVAIVIAAGVAYLLISGAQITVGEMAPKLSATDRAHGDVERDPRRARRGPGSHSVSSVHRGPSAWESRPVATRHLPSRGYVYPDTFAAQPPSPPRHGIETAS